MRVIFLTHYYPPEVGAPQARIAALAHGLRRAGVEVAVHTCFPHYPSGRIAPPYRNRLVQVESDSSVPVVRSAVYPAANRGVRRRLADHASFAASALVTAPRAGPADVVVAESPPLFTAVAAVPYAKLKRAALVVNVADRWPASAVELGMLRSRAAIAAAAALERACYGGADAITVPTAAMASAIGALPAAREKVHVVAPSVSLERFRVTPHRSDGPLRVIYAGTIGLAHGLETLVDAAALAGAEVIELTIAGDGAELPALRERVARGHLQNVRLLGSVAVGEVPSLLAEADVAAVVLRDRPVFREALPTKMLEAMAAGRGLVVSARGNAAQLVEATGTGIAVPPEDPPALAAALARLADDRELVRRLGEAGRLRAEQDYGREAAVTRWLEVLEAAARSSASRA